MERPVKGKTLLVGEGDFSFTVAMVTNFPATAKEEVVSSSIETAESILKHKNAVENMKMLQENGVRVFLEVDATELHKHQTLKDEKFSRIIFNFPHSGGKSNHKRNRKLLNDFFASAIHVLEEDGQILVTLCKGQGGTPADRPMRAWHDSWQVVSMAANSSLILMETLPFQVEDFETYTSTGFRSLDKGFHTDNAITHVFEKADPVIVPDVTRDYCVTVNNEIYTCPRYIYNKLNVLREIDILRNHPFSTIPMKLTEIFTEKDKAAPEKPSETTCMLTDAEISVSDSLSTDADISVCKLLTCDSCSNEERLAQNDHHYESADGYDVVTPKYELKRTNSIEENHLNKSLGKPLEKLRVPDNLCKYDSNCDELSLRASLLENFKGPKRPSVTCCHMESGPVFRPGWIETGHLPIQYQMLIVWQTPTEGKRFENWINNTERQMNNSEHQMNCSENQINEETNKGENSKSGKKDAETLEGGNTGSTHHIVDLVSRTIHNLKTMLEEDCNIQFHCSSTHIHVGRSELNYVNREDFTSLGFLVIKCDNRELNKIPLGELVQIKENREPDCSTHTGLVLFLDEIASILLNLSDKRLLYSLDKRFTNQFLNSYKADSHLGSAIKVPSLYPMTFVHDMSFWENEKLEFDERAFCDTVRNIADDTVVSIELIDKYKDPQTERLSRCYRMVFQSPNRALCYDTSWKLQSLIRLEVEKHLKIILR